MKKKRFFYHPEFQQRSLLSSILAKEILYRLKLEWKITLLNFSNLHLGDFKNEKCIKTNGCVKRMVTLIYIIPNKSDYSFQFYN